MDEFERRTGYDITGAHGFFQVTLRGTQIPLIEYDPQKPVHLAPILTIRVTFLKIHDISLRLDGVDRIPPCSTGNIIPPRASSRTGMRDINLGTGAEERREARDNTGDQSFGSPSS